MPIKSVLVVGGAGYIGSHMVRCLMRAGYHPVVFDNFSTGHLDVVNNIECVRGDIADKEALNSLFSRYNFLAVMHFASFIQVGESVIDPLKYYFNNVQGTLNLLHTMLDHGLTKFIFSSSAAVYGEPHILPIPENHVLQPVNPYGKSKYMVEQILEDLSRAHDFRYMTLRYFNAAGADVSNRLAERHDPETHLIPLVLQVAQKRKSSIMIYGKDYPTEDGTCIRDYIHVVDLCSAHLKALECLLDGKKNGIYNLGTGEGYSVQQVVDMARAVTQLDIPIVYGERRLGDPAVLIANAQRAQCELGWRPCFSSLRRIIEDAWQALSFGV